MISLIKRWATWMCWPESAPSSNRLVDVTFFAVALVDFWRHRRRRWNHGKEGWKRKTRHKRPLIDRHLTSLLVNTVWLIDWQTAHFPFLQFLLFSLSSVSFLLLLLLLFLFCFFFLPNYHPLNSQRIRFVYHLLSLSGLRSFHVYRCMSYCSPACWLHLACNVKTSIHPEPATVC